MGKGASPPPRVTACSSCEGDVRNYGPSDQGDRAGAAARGGGAVPGQQPGAYGDRARHSRLGQPRLAAEFPADRGDAAPGNGGGAAVLLLARLGGAGARVLQDGGEGAAGRGPAGQDDLAADRGDDSGGAVGVVSRDAGEKPILLGTGAAAAGSVPLLEWGGAAGGGAAAPATGAA